MPTLHWIGKEKVINHHLDVPYRVLEHGYGFVGGQTSDRVTQSHQVTTPDGQSTDRVTQSHPVSVPPSGNKIIHGDNLEALKALLPEYEGKIKCIYIDPPYNTGEEGWVYNDNSNDPKIKKWLGSIVGKEGDDLSRHDKWLCMMYPRLKLLHKLLSIDGFIVISIDDNEVSSLKLICDEVFGTGNFIANVIWQKRTSPDARKNLAAAHDYILFYRKNKENSNLKLVPISGDRTKDYKNPDNDPRGKWASVDLSGQSGHATSEQYFIITTPSGKKYKPPEGRCWAIAEKTFINLSNEGRIWFGKTGSSRPRMKKFLSEVEGTTSWTWWPHSEVGHTQFATKELKEIFGGESKFNTSPKPTTLINKILKLISDTDSIILDSFAGSSTTAHAVLNLNQQDGGNRQFILVEMEDYAETITAERVRRVISGYGQTAGTGGSFDYYTLGAPMFLEDGNLNESVGVERIRKYVFYTETKTPMPSVASGDNAAFIGQHNGTAYYFHYEPEAVTTLDHAFLATVKAAAEQYVIYADNCLLTKEYRAKHQLIFKKIPRDITRF